MAYGSGVFQQAGHVRNQNTMVDLIFAVDNPEQWHGRNIALNPNHYSEIRRLGAAQISAIQDWGTAKLYYNPFVTVDGMLLKYGVISQQALLDDLVHWTSLYTSGRLHKPVHVITADQDCQAAMASNLRSAFITGCLLSPETFNKRQLFEAIASISYSGDPRMVVGESKGKVASIVQGSYDGFCELYGPLLGKETEVYHRGDIITNERAQQLPSHLQEQLRERGWTSDEIPTNAQLRGSLEAIVKSSAVVQSLKGVLTAGPFKAAVYAKEKLMKTFK